jgi:hypothetical protein
MRQRRCATAGMRPVRARGTRIVVAAPPRLPLIAAGLTRRPWPQRPTLGAVRWLTRNGLDLGPD